MLVALYSSSAFWVWLFLFRKNKNKNKCLMLLVSCVCGQMASGHSQLHGPFLTTYPMPPDKMKYSLVWYEAVEYLKEISFWKEKCC